YWRVVAPIENPRRRAPNVRFRISPQSNPRYECTIDRENQETPPMSFILQRLFSATLCGLVTGLLTAGPAHAQTVEQFYKGKIITILVGTSPGGINDITARFAAKHFGRFIPGNPSIVVQQTPGGGGLVTANRIYQATEHDGTVLAKLERAT